MYLHLKTFVFTFVINLVILLSVKLEKIEYEGFDWDYGNFLHAQHHDISFDAIEKIFEQELLYFLDT